MIWKHGLILHAGKKKSGKCMYLCQSVACMLQEHFYRQNRSCHFLTWQCLAAIPVGFGLAQKRVLSKMSVLNIISSWFCALEARDEILVVLADPCNLQNSGAQVNCLLQDYRKSYSVVPWSLDFELESNIFPLLSCILIVNHWKWGYFIFLPKSEFRIKRYWR